MSDWKSLEEQSQNLIPGTDNHCIQRNLRGIEKEAHRLRTKKAENSSLNNIAKHVPIGKIRDYALEAGYDINQQSRLISSVDHDQNLLNINDANTNTTTTTNGGTRIDANGNANATGIDIHNNQLLLLPNASINAGAANANANANAMSNLNMNLDEFLSNHNEYVICCTLQESQCLAARNFREKQTQSMQNEWSQTKREILQYLGCNDQHLNLLSMRIGAGVAAGATVINTINPIQNHLSSQLNISSAINNTTNTNANTNQTSLSLLNLSKVDSSINNHNQNNNTMDTQQQQQQPQPFFTSADANNQNIQNNVLLNDWESEFALIVAKMCNNQLATSNVSNIEEGVTAPFSAFANTHQQLCIAFFEQLKQTTNVNVKANVTEKEEYAMGCLEDIWLCMSRMVNETGQHFEDENSNNNNSNSNSEILAPNVYASAYARKSLGLQRLLVNNSKSYLERAFMTKIRMSVQDNMDIARLGGVMSNMAYIIAYVRLQFQFQFANQQNNNNNGNGNSFPSHYKSVTINNEVLPLYPLLYYCLRVGQIDDCVRIAHISAHSTVIHHALKQIQMSRFKLRQEFSTKTNPNSNSVLFNQDSKMETLMNILETQCFDQLDEQFWESNFAKHYKEQITERSQDPFEVLIYLVLGKFVDVTQNWIDLSFVLETTEDFVWFKLSTLIDTNHNSNSNINDVNINVNENDINRLPEWLIMCSSTADIDIEQQVYIPSSLQKLQNNIRNLGPNHFDNPLIFVHTLLLTQQFEVAIEYLLGIRRVHAIHLALALNYYGLLITNKDKDVQFQLQRFELFDHIRRYCSRLLNANSQISHFVFFYLFLLHSQSKADSDSDSNSNSNSNSDESVAQLVEYLSAPNPHLIHQLLGSISNQGIRIRNSLLFKYPFVMNNNHNHSFSFADICEKSGVQASKYGEMVHSVRLFMFAANYSEAARVCTRLLASQVRERADSAEKKIALDLVRDLVLAQSKGSSFHDLANSSSSSSTNIKLEIDAAQSYNLMTAKYMCEFFDCFRSSFNDYDKALDIIKQCAILPIDEQTIAQFQHWSQNQSQSQMQMQNNNRSQQQQQQPSFDFQLNAEQERQMFSKFESKIAQLEKELRKFLPEICLNVMQIWTTKLNQLTHSQFQSQSQSQSNVQRKQELSQMCTILYTFYQSIPAHLVPCSATTNHKMDEFYSLTKN